MKSHDDNACMDVQDPLKPLSEIFEPDPRRAHLVGTLEDEHADLMSITLHEGVPQPVRQLFETAKNVSLYSWFVFRFHPIAESAGLGALELALNLRRSGDRCLAPGFRSPGLRQLLKNAIAEKRIREDAFPSRAARVRRAAEQRIVLQIITQKSDGARVPPITPEDQRDSEHSVSITSYLAALLPEIRNAMAHGSPRLAPRSRFTLRLIAETINQLFRNVPGE